MRIIRLLALAFTLTMQGSLLQTALGQSFGSIRGRVMDGESGQPLRGANVLLETNGRGSSTDSEGHFEIPRVPVGNHTVSVSFLGYIVTKRTIAVSEGEATNITFELSPTILKGQVVVITATRAKERETPVAFSNIDSKDIQTRYWAQDLPMLLSEQPNVYAYSDNGNGIGYSYMRMRGFDQKRIGVMINGIPLNDAESHEVFWVDLPDFAANTEDIQIQRGVGKTLYGASAFGGSVNLSTISSRRQGIEMSIGAGSYGTRKYSLAASSGLIDNTYSLFSRFTRIETEGYRDPSWSKLWSYYVSATRYDERMTTRFTAFGGPEQSYLSYRGITAEQLADRDQRRINPFRYPNEVDNFYQPHFQLTNEWKVSESLHIDNSLFVFLGLGDYTQSRSRRDVREYNIPRFSVADSTLLPANYYDVDANGNPKRRSDGLFQVRRLDIIRKRSVDDLDFGWLPRVTYALDRGDITLGGELRRHRGHHWGEVVWANTLPPGITPDWRYYDYVVPKTSISLYAHHLHHFTDALHVMAGLQYSHHALRLKDEKNFNVQLDRTYGFLNPRLGVNYNATAEFNVFASFSMASREPAFKDIYNPQDYWTNPLNLPKNFQQIEGGYLYNGKELKPERFLNIEAGGGYQSEEVSIKANFFWMNFRDEIIASGQVDDNGVPIAGNAESTVHRGIEISGSWNPIRDLTVTANGSYNDNRFIKHTEYVVTDWNTVPPTVSPVVLDDKKIGGFPDIIGNLRVTYRFTDMMASVHLQRIGKLYLDNTENADRSIEPVLLLNATLGYDFGPAVGLPGLDVRLFFNNLTDKLFAAGGYVEDGTAYFIPAAGRNFFASITTRF